MSSLLKAKALLFTITVIILVLWKISLNYRSPNQNGIIPCLLPVWSLYCGFSDPPSTRKTWRSRPPVWSARNSADKAVAPAIPRSLKREASQPEDNLRQILISREDRIASLIACTQPRSPARQPWISCIAENSSFFLGFLSHSEVEDFSQLLTLTLHLVFRLWFVVLLVFWLLQWGPGVSKSRYFARSIAIKYSNFSRFL